MVALWMACGYLVNCWGATALQRVRYWHASADPRLRGLLGLAVVSRYKWWGTTVEAVVPYLVSSVVAPIRLVLRGRGFDSCAWGHRQTGWSRLCEHRKGVIVDTATREWLRRAPEGTDLVAVVRILAIMDAEEKAKARRELDRARDAYWGGEWDSEDRMVVR